MDTNWRSQIETNKSIFEDYAAMGKPIPESEKINIHCPKCGYHTGWNRGGQWQVCGWCFTNVGADRERLNAVTNSIKTKVKS